MRYLSARLTAIVLAVLLVILGFWTVTGRVSAHDTGAPAKASATHILSVNGHGEVSATPDMATITLGVETKGSDAQEALSKNASKMNSVIAAVKAEGIADNRIKTSGLSLYFDSQNGDYVASHQLTVRVDDISKVGPILDTSVAAGATSTWGVDFGLKDNSATQSQALKAAVTDARRRADAMASALNVTITGVGSASEGGYSSPPVFYAGANKAAGAPSAATTVQPGLLQISADVSVSYTYNQ